MKVFVRGAINAWEYEVIVRTKQIKRAIKHGQVTGLLSETRISMAEEMLKKMSLLPTEYHKVKECMRIENQIRIWKVRKWEQHSDLKKQ